MTFVMSKSLRHASCDPYKPEEFQVPMTMNVFKAEVVVNV